MEIDWKSRASVRALSRAEYSEFLNRGPTEWNRALSVGANADFRVHASVKLNKEQK